MEVIYLSIGSNRGRAGAGRMNLILSAETMILDKVGAPVKISSLYESDPWGFKDPVSFYNAVIGVKTALSPEDALGKIREIEKALGRVRTLNSPRRAQGCRIYKPRTIDIDILFFGRKVISNADLIIPHPLLHLRRFVLAPLAEIAPDFMHPSLGKTIAELLSSCADTGKVTRL